MLSLLYFIFYTACFIYSKILPQDRLTPKNILFFTLFRGITIFFSFSVLGLCYFIYLFLVPVSSDFDALFRLVYLVFGIFAYLYYVIDFIKLVKETNFVDKEFTIHEDKILYRFPAKTKLERKRPAETKDQVKVNRLIGGVIAVVLPLAYPIQSIIFSESGTVCVLLLMAMIGFPLFIS